MKNIFTVLAASVLMAAPAMAHDFNSRVFANSDVKAVELSQAEMKETQGELLPLAVWGLGGAAVGMWAEHGKSLYSTARLASVDEVSRAGVNGALVGTVGRNLRIAPIGNSTGHSIGRFPHYHRRVVDQFGNGQPGKGIGRHRPWESKPTDRSWRDRF